MLANQHNYVFILGENKTQHKTENTMLNEDQVWLAASFTISSFVLCSCTLI